jgi:hypothetical protein
MTCEYCNTEHPVSMIRDPRYCIAQMGEQIAALTAENERLKSDHACGDCPMLNSVVSENNKICKRLDEIRIDNKILREKLWIIRAYNNYVREIIEQEAALKTEGEVQK